jgi:hypothetical protein
MAYHHQPIFQQPPPYHQPAPRASRNDQQIVVKKSDNDKVRNATFPYRKMKDPSFLRTLQPTNEVLTLHGVRIHALFKAEWDVVDENQDLRIFRTK